MRGPAARRSYTWDHVKVKDIQDEFWKVVKQAKRQLEMCQTCSWHMVYVSDTSDEGGLGDCGRHAGSRKSKSWKEMKKVLTRWP